MKTYSPKSSEITRAWHLIDAKDQVLGRLATSVANLLMGKSKPIFSRHLDMADHIVVTNAAAVKVTGKKEKQKLYRRHSGYPGGMVVHTLSQVRAAHPDRIIIHAVSGMLPKNKLQDRLLTHLHVYPGPDHPYASNFKQS
ncbi:MAG: 50S ribosomal protein L13 [Microgenomates group bacterium Gr01-1014_16]|nr:MAG: 50S ribosomal protein L13 [Microgenomates group bacterium Gr01-1014_16]